MKIRPGDVWKVAGGDIFNGYRGNALVIGKRKIVLKVRVVTEYVVLVESEIPTVHSASPLSKWYRAIRIIRHKSFIRRIYE